MSNENPAIQINFKTKKDGMLINLRANDLLELDTLVDGITQRLATLVDLEQTTEAMATPTVASVSQQLGAQVIPSAPAFKPAAPVGGAPDCACGGGPMRYVPAGISSKTGKSYKGFYACPRPQGQACNHKV